MHEDVFTKPGLHLKPNRSREAALHFCPMSSRLEQIINLIYSLAVSKTKNVAEGHSAVQVG